MAIAVIAKAYQPMFQTELAHRLGVEDPTMVSMIDRVAKAGFIVRVPWGSLSRFPKAGV